MGDDADDTAGNTQSRADRLTGRVAGKNHPRCSVNAYPNEFLQHAKSKRVVVAVVVDVEIAERYNSRNRNQGGSKVRDRINRVIPERENGEHYFFVDNTCRDTKRSLGSEEAHRAESDAFRRNFL